MRISTATIDCWLDVSGPSYSDFQHHHWEVGPSVPIDDTVNNTPTYSWSLNESGNSSSGSWSVNNQQLPTLNAQVRKISPTTVLLRQTQGFGVHQLPVIASSSVTNHTVSEMTWPTLMWDANAGTPSSVTYRDAGQPVVIPGSRKAELLLVQSLVPIPSVIPGVAVFGGQDWTHGAATFYQRPAGAISRAWWAWTINLAP
jgi:hypothetical protein